MTRTSNHDWQIPEVGGDTNTWGNILNALFEEMDDQIILDGPLSDRPSGDNTDLVYYHSTDESIIYYNDDTTWVPISGVSEEDTFSFTSGHTAWESGLVDEEINRFGLASNEKFTLLSLEFTEKGGGTEDTSAYLSVYDNTVSQEIERVNLNKRKEVKKESVDGANILFRLTNESGSTVDASVTVRGTIE